MRSVFWGSLDLEQKSSADERKAYIGTLSEETAIEKEHKNGKNSENFNLKKSKMQNFRAKIPFFTISSLFFVCA